MPWQEQSAMSLRREFVTFAARREVPMQVLCAQFGIAPKTGYKWLTRAAEEGETALLNRSRRPHHSPGQTAPAVVERILELRDAAPTWGGRKLHVRLGELGVTEVPAPSTITDILRRHGRIGPGSAGPGPWQRFEHPAPNDLWQLDFMGHRPLDRGRVHPLTLLDDHSRFGLLLAACPHERGAVVHARLTACFRRYGLPRIILADNGPPWGAMGAGGITRLEAWLLRLGVALRHGRAWHPQTQGKVERWHRTIAAEVFARGQLPDRGAAQQHFDRFRDRSNHERPHQALALAVPAARLTPSPRPFPEAVPQIVYAPDETVWLVRGQGAISFHNRSYFVSRGLIGLPVAIRPTTTDGVFEVRFCQRLIRLIDLRDG